eukprot:899189-Amphidinium_carterae.1
MGISKTLIHHVILKQVSRLHLHTQSAAALLAVLYKNAQCVDLLHLVAPVAHTESATTPFTNSTACSHGDVTCLPGAWHSGRSDPARGLQGEGPRVHGCVGRFDVREWHWHYSDIMTTSPSAAIWNLIKFTQLRQSSHDRTGRFSSLVGLQCLF